MTKIKLFLNRVRIITLIETIRGPTLTLLLNLLIKAEVIEEAPHIKVVIAKKLFDYLTRVNFSFIKRRVILNVIIPKKNVSTINVVIILLLSLTII